MELVAQTALHIAWGLIPRGSNIYCEIRQQMYTQCLAAVPLPSMRNRKCPLHKNLFHFSLQNSLAILSFEPPNQRRVDRQSQHDVLWSGHDMLSLLSRWGMEEDLFSTYIMLHTSAHLPALYTESIRYNWGWHNSTFQKDCGANWGTNMSGRLVT